MCNYKNQLIHITLYIGNLRRSLGGFVLKESMLQNPTLKHARKNQEQWGCLSGIKCLPARASSFGEAGSVLAE